MSEDDDQRDSAGDQEDRPDMTDPDSDPFHPPSIPTLVHCLHCDEEYESFQIEYIIEQFEDGRKMGFWCCPMEGCGGKGFGFDILPVDGDWVDPDGRDMGWDMSDEDEEESEDFDDEQGWSIDDDFDDDSGEDVPF